MSDQLNNMHQLAELIHQQYIGLSNLLYDLKEAGHLPEKEIKKLHIIIAMHNKEKELFNNSVISNSGRKNNETHS